MEPPWATVSQFACCSHSHSQSSAYAGEKSVATTMSKEIAVAVRRNDCERRHEDTVDFG